MKKYLLVAGLGTMVANVFGMFPDVSGSSHSNGKKNYYQIAETSEAQNKKTKISRNDLEFMNSVFDFEKAVSDYVQNIVSINSLQSNDFTLLKQGGTFPSLEELTICLEHILKIPLQNLEFPKLKELTIISGSRYCANNLESLNTLISKASSTLQRLEIEGVYLGNHLPEAIGKCTNLTDLNLSRTDLTNLPAEIRNLTNLKILNLSENGLEDLPAEIWNLTNLKILDLSGNVLEDFPAEIGNQTNLQKLNLLDNVNINLPEAVSKLQNLEMLDLSDNYVTIEETIKKIKNLQKLKTLSFSYAVDYIRNHLDIVPPEIGDLKSLEKLDIFGREDIKSIPPEIGKLRNLRFLNIAQTDIKTLPSEIGELINLEELYLDHNASLESLPKEIGDLLNLKELEFGKGNYSEDSDVDNEDSSVLNIWNFIEDSDQTSLDLSGKNLRHIPFDIIYMKQLEKLNLRNNQLKDLHAFMVQLQNLKELDLRGNSEINSVNKVHDAIFGLPLLEKFWITTEDGQDEEYKKEQISEIRKARINKILNKLREIQDPIDCEMIKRFIFLGKHKTPTRMQQMRNYLKYYQELEKSEYAKAREKAPAEKVFLIDLLSKLEDALSIQED